MNVTCLKCKRISFAVSRQYAEAEVKNFNEYFATLDKKTQDELYGGKGSSIDSYACLYCGGNNFRPSTESEIAKTYGCTINPVIFESEAKP